MAIPIPNEPTPEQLEKLTGKPATATELQKKIEKESTKDSESDDIESGRSPDGS